MDGRKLALLLRWLPEEPWSWLDRILVITHRDRPDLVEELIDIKREYGRHWPIDIRTDRSEETALDIIDAPPALRTYFQHLLGVKLMLPVTLKTPLLFTDDDVIVTRDPEDLIATNLPWFSHSGLDGYTETAKDLEAFDTVRRSFDLYGINLREFNRRRTDAGVWFLPTLDRTLYIRCLHRYFSDPHVVAVSHDVGTAPCGHTQRFRKLDQRFLSGHVIMTGGISVIGPHYRALADKKIPKSVPGATFVHYCASGQKERYVEWLEREVPWRDF
jgi:hypothetical protein